jgi:hypothetical protein
MKQLQIDDQGQPLPQIKLDLPVAESPISAATSLDNRYPSNDRLIFTSDRFCWRSREIQLERERY